MWKDRRKQLVFVALLLIGFATTLFIRSRTEAPDRDLAKQKPELDASSGEERDPASSEPTKTPTDSPRAEVEVGNQKQKEDLQRGLKDQSQLRQVRGQVKPGNLPIEDFVVAAFAIFEGAPERRVANRLSLQGDGKFELNFDRDGPYALVVLTPERSDGVRPLTRIVNVVLGPATELGLLEPTMASALSGWALDPERNPIGEAAIYISSCHSASDDPVVKVDSIQMNWSANQFELRELVVQAKPDGSFHVSGLQQGHCFKLYARRLGLFWNHLGNSSLERANAPATGVELMVRSTSTLIRVTGAGVPVKAEYSLDQGSYGVSGRTEENGQTQLEIGVNATAQFEFWASGFKRKKLKFKPEELVHPLRVNVDLEASPDASLGLRMHPGLQSQLGSFNLTIELYDRVLVSSERMNNFGNKWPWGSHPDRLSSHPNYTMLPKLTRNGNELHVTPLEPGSYWMRVLPHSNPKDGLAPAWTNQLLELELQAGEQTLVDWDPPLGGRLAVDIRQAAQSQLTFSILTLDGHRIQSDYTHGPQHSSRANAPQKLGLSTARTPLTPGIYELFVHNKQAGQLSQIFDIHPGKTTTLTLDLSTL